jgi:hypothetical protein
MRTGAIFWPHPVVERLLFPLLKMPKNIEKVRVSAPFNPITAISFIQVGQTPGFEQLESYITSKNGGSLLCLSLARERVQ